MSVVATFGARLKELREAHTDQLTQVQLADKLGVSRASIGFYEKGERTPDIEFLERTACFFNVSYDYLLGKTDAKQADNTEINKRLHLSDKAVQAIEKWVEFGSIGEFNALLENFNFDRTIHTLGKLRKYVDSPETYLLGGVPNLFMPDAEPFSKTANKILSAAVGCHYESIAGADIARFLLAESKDHFAICLNDIYGEVKYRLSDDMKAFMATANNEELAKDAALTYAVKWKAECEELMAELVNLFAQKTAANKDLWHTGGEGVEPDGNA